ncbi:MAG: DUF1906 domain-containing protein [Chloroflexi bacterium]|nr:MAG: DUF1906 domain-containing protein [Chloroflexota bacterium]
MTIVAFAAPAVLAVPPLHSDIAICESSNDCTVQTANRVDPSLAVPSGLQPCPDSGAASACSTSTSPASAPPGTAVTPVGQTACASTGTEQVPPTPATCSNEVIQPDGPSKARASGPLVIPSVPGASLGVHGPDHVVLTADATTLRAGAQVLLSATASSSTSGTGMAIEIFDQTSRVVVAACVQGNRCSVAYSASAGVHDFTAFATRPTSQIPDAASAVSSNKVSVGWLNSSITASRTVLGQGQAVTLVATSTVDVYGTGRWLEIYDLTTNSRLTYCSRGTVCTTSMRASSGGVHEIVGYVNGQPEAVSSPVYVTWLNVSLSATSIGPATGGAVYLKAVSNADLTDTPWVVGIYDDKGRLVDHACKSGDTCRVHTWISGGTTPTYTAVIGALPSAAQGAQPAHGQGSTGTPGLVDIQARSVAVEPTHLLWGVDSCKAFTGDPSGQEVYPSVVSTLGVPDFWGRYLTNTVCPGISSAEVALAARNHMGILPIYNDYNCSNVSYYETGHRYAAEAVAAAQRIGIPNGRLLAIDIEPYGDACPGAGSVDSGFIEGWFDGVSRAGYVPAFYGNGTSGSEFAAAWCTAVTSLPNIATGSDLWSFEPSLLGGYAKSSAPNYAPYDTGCAGNIEAWQYELGSNGPDPDVDQDEALSTLPLWYPTNTP